MDIKILDYMLLIAKEKSISRAADRLYLSQPSLSRHVRKIEQQIGAKIFQRQSNELHLTDAGRIFINNSMAILHIHKEAMERLETMRMEQKDKLRVIVGTKESPFFMRKIVPAFQELYPNISLVVTEGNASTAEEYVANDLADIGILSTFGAIDHSLDTTLLDTDEMLLVLPGESTAAKQVQAHGVCFEFMEQDCFILNSLTDEYRHMEQQIFAMNRFVPSHICEVSKFRTALHMVQNGVGNTFLPKSLIKAAGQNTYAVSLVPPCTFKRMAVYQRGKQFPHYFQSFLNIVADRFATIQNYLKHQAQEK